MKQLLFFILMILMVNNLSAKDWEKDYRKELKSSGYSTKEIENFVNKERKRREESGEDIADKHSDLPSGLRRILVSFDKEIIKENNSYKEKIKKLKSDLIKNLRKAQKNIVSRGINRNIDDALKKGLEFSEAIKRYERMTTQDFIQMSPDGAEVIITVPCNAKSRSIIIDGEVTIRVFEEDRWNAIDDQEKSVNFLGHVNYTKYRAKNGLPFGAMCYSLNSTDLIPITKSKFKLKGKGTLCFGCIDLESTSANMKNNSGEIRVAILGLKQNNKELDNIESKSKINISKENKNYNKKTESLKKALLKELKTLATKTTKIGKPKDAITIRKVTKRYGSYQAKNFILFGNKAQPGIVINVPSNNFSKPYKLNGKIKVLIYEEDRWTSNKNKFDLVNFRGYRKQDKLPNGLALGQLCYQINNGKKIALTSEETIIEGKGTLIFLSSDNGEKGHSMENNMGFIRVKIVELK